MKLSKKEQELFNSCHLHCLVCMSDGSCVLQKKYLKEMEKQRKVYEIECKEAWGDLRHDQ